MPVAVPRCQHEAAAEPPTGAFGSPLQGGATNKTVIGGRGAGVLGPAVCTGQSRAHLVAVVGYTVRRSIMGASSDGPPGRPGSPDSRAGASAVRHGTHVRNGSRAAGPVRLPTDSPADKLRRPASHRPADEDCELSRVVDRARGVRRRRDCSRGGRRRRRRTPLFQSRLGRQAPPPPPPHLPPPPPPNTPTPPP